MADHGTATRYQYGGCRCDRCRKAASDKCRGLRQARLAERVVDGDGRLIHPRAPHGTHGGSSNWGCGCLECTEAHRLYEWDRREARAADCGAVNNGAPSTP